MDQDNNIVREITGSSVIITFGYFNGVLKEIGDFLATVEIVNALAYIFQHYIGKDIVTSKERLHPKSRLVSKSTKTH